MTGFDANPSSLRGAVDLSSLVQRAQAPAAGTHAGAPAHAPGAGAPGQPGDAGQPGQPVAPGTPIPVPALAYDLTDAGIEEVVALSMSLPVVALVWSPRSTESAELGNRMTAIVEALGGRVVLAKIDGDANPQLASAFQVQAVPTVLGILGGRPLPMFEGDQPDQAVSGIIGQLIQVAAESGIAGIAQPEEAPHAAASEPEPLPPLHQEAFDAIEAGDFPRAIAAYERAIAQNPRDEVARAGLSQVRLLDRLSHGTLEEIRAAAAAGPTDIPAQLAVADLDVSGGHVEDAFARLLGLFPDAEEADRTAIRERLVELFSVVGVDDPRVARARARLTNLLF